MTEIVRYCFLKFPPVTVTINDPFSFSITICTDLGVICGTRLEEFDLSISLIPFKKQISLSTSAKPIICLDGLANVFTEKGLQLNFLEPRNGRQISPLCTVFKLKGGEGYVEYNFSGVLKASVPKEIEPTSRCFLLKIELDDLGAVRLAGGFSLQNIYFLSLYSNPIFVVGYKGLKKGIDKLSDPMDGISDAQALLGSRRYFEFSPPATPSLLGASMLVLEAPFGKDLGSHCWDCAWIGLEFLSRLLLAFKGLVTEEHIDIELVTELRDIILNVGPEEIFLELGSGCGLLSLGLAAILSEFNLSSREHQLQRNHVFNILLSDQAAVLPSCCRNIRANFNLDFSNLDANHVQFKKVGKKVALGLIELQWEAPLKHDILLNPAVIFVFDVVYNDAAHMPLFTVLRNLVKASFNPNKTCILLGYKQRSKRVERGFFDLVRPHFSLTRILFQFGVHLLLLKPIPGSF